MFTSRSSQQVLLAIFVGILLGCVCGAVALGAMIGPALVETALAPTATLTLTPTPKIFPTITLKPAVTRTTTPAPFPPTSTAAPSIPLASRTATRTPRPVTEHFLVTRPVALSIAQAKPLVNPDPVYLYGTTRFGDLDVHHGEEFENPTGTPLFAVADGTIVVAGQDNAPLCGDDGTKVCGRDLSLDSGGYYGNVVALQLDQPYNGQRVFALYGHMNKITVAKGDKVKEGDPIGEIGMSGVALGPHIHFEIRLGTNDYAHTRNPILWTTPLPGRGALVGRINDFKGNLLRGAIVSVTNVDGNYPALSTETYSRDRWPAVNSDDELGENFAMPDLPTGDYIIRVQGQQLATRATIQDGQITFVDIGLPPPPTITPTNAMTATPAP